MKPRRHPVPGCFGYAAAILPLAFLVLGPCLPALKAQPVVPPQAVQQFQQVIGNRTEAAVILGGDYGAMGGIYTFRGGNLAELDVSKVGGGGDVAAQRLLGLGGLEWAPVLQGNLGHLTANNDFSTGFLRGNTSVYDIWAVEAGGGARFYFNDHWSLAPTVSGIYGHVENTFEAHNATGRLVETAASGTYVDWNLDTWSVVPSLELSYELKWRRTTFDFSSRYDFFHTESFRGSSPVVGVNGDSQTWENKLDVDVPLGWRLLGRELHTGGFFSRTELFGDIAKGLGDDHFYTVNGRVVLDMLGKVWKLRWIGVGASYFFADHFTGWTAGLDVRFQF
jgi:hypothetical protein